MEDLDTEVEINTVRETIIGNINMTAKESLGYYELKQHKPWLEKNAQNY
jgi:hypothetical protein